MATKTTIEMAREAAGDDWGLFQEYMPEIHRLVELVRADERARMAEQPAQTEVIAGRTVKVDWKTQALELRELVRLGGIKIAELEMALAEQPAQRPWVGLTDEEIGQVLDDPNVAEAHQGHWLVLPFAFARAIETKLRSKNT